MKKVSLILLVLLLTGLTVVPALAQATLTQSHTHESDEGSFSFMVPEDWMIYDMGGGIVLGTQTMNGKIDYPMPFIGTAKETVTAIVRSDSPAPEVTELEIGGHSAARAVSVSGANNYLYIAVDFDDGTVAMFGLIGSAADVSAAEPTLLAIIGSFQRAGDASPIGGVADAAPMTATTEAAALPVVDGVPQIAFAVSDIAIDIFRINPADLTVARVTKDERNASYPAWSPDGTMLAFNARTQDSESAYDIVVVRADGSDRRVVSSASFFGSATPVAWSPDSRQLVYIGQRDSSAGAYNYEIFTVNVDGTGETRLELPNVVEGTIFGGLLDWSPDGQQIAFVASLVGGDYGLVFADADGKNVGAVPAFDSPRGGTDFKWSPDGQRALFSDGRSVTVAAADGSAQEVVLGPSDNLVIIAGIAWSPDGAQIAFTTLGYEEFDTGLYVMNADGSDLHRLDLGENLTSNYGLSWRAIPAAFLNGTGAAAPTDAPADAAPTTESSAAASGACTVTAAQSANLRSGPGTTFARAGSLAAGVSQTVTGQAKGADGFVWWQLDDSN